MNSKLHLGINTKSIIHLEIQVERDMMKPRNRKWTKLIN